MNGNKIILNTILNNGKIDNHFCINNKITTRLAARIYDLKKKGYIFETLRNFNNTKNTLYILKGTPKKEGHERNK